MAIKTVLGAQRAGGFGTIQVAASGGGSRADLVAAVRSEYPSLHWTRAEQLVSLWERSVSAAVSGAARYGTQNTPGLFSAHKYVLKAYYRDPETGDETSVPVILTSDRALSVSELASAAEAKVYAAEVNKTPDYTDVVQVSPETVGYEIIVHQQRV